MLKTMLVSRIEYEIPAAAQEVIDLLMAEVEKINGRIQASSCEAERHAWLGKRQRVISEASAIKALHSFPTLVEYRTTTSQPGYLLSLLVAEE